MKSNQLNAKLIFFVFGIIFLAKTIAAPPSKSEEEFIEDAEEDGVLAQEVDLDDYDIYGEDSFDEFRKQPHSHGDDDFESGEKPHPGDDLIYGNHGHDHILEEEPERSDEDIGRDLTGEESEGETDGKGEVEGDYGEGDDEWYDDDDEDWYGPADNDETNWDEGQDGNGENNWDENQDGNEEIWDANQDGNDENNWDENQNGNDDDFGIGDDE